MSDSKESTGREGAEKPFSGVLRARPQMCCHVGGNYKQVTHRPGTGSIQCFDAGSIQVFNTLTRIFVAPATVRAFVESYNLRFPRK
jgi:hypothetical protein